MTRFPIETRVSVVLHKPHCDRVFIGKSYGGNLTTETGFSGHVSEYTANMEKRGFRVDIIPVPIR